MSKGRRLVLMLALTALGGAPARADGPRPSPMEPPDGAMTYGQSVLVDDGTCPTGQIKKVTAGNMTTPLRIRTCVRKH